MSDNTHVIPETHVLAIASHVTSGYVGNSMATFCMQTLGCEVSAIHTVNYSNHVAYKRFKGRKSTPEEVAELYAGLREAHLADFDMMLSGYCPSAALVEQVGRIARDLKLRAATKPGAFFWVLDPVMGDNGRMYVAEETVPAYRALLPDADLILPNQFEAELLSGVRIVDLPSLHRAVAALHRTYGLPHVIITSLRLPSITPPASGAPGTETDVGDLAVVGSTATSGHEPRLFRIAVPALPVFFSGTGDMFAALLVSRLRQAARDAGVLSAPHWRGTAAADDALPGPELPLAKAAEKVLASMHAVLLDTAAFYAKVQAETEEQEKEEKEKKEERQGGKGTEAQEQEALERHLRLTRAAEVRVVRNAGMLRTPPDLQKFRAEVVEVGEVATGSASEDKGE